MTCIVVALLSSLASAVGIVLMLTGHLSGTATVVYVAAIIATQVVLDISRTRARTRTGPDA